MTTTLNWRQAITSSLVACIAGGVVLLAVGSHDFSLVLAIAAAVGGSRLTELKARL